MKATPDADCDHMDYGRPGDGRDPRVRIRAVGWGGWARQWFQGWITLRQTHEHSSDDHPEAPVLHDQVKKGWRTKNSKKGITRSTPVVAMCARTWSFCRGWRLKYNSPVILTFCIFSSALTVLDRTISQVWCTHKLCSKNEVCIATALAIHNPNPNATFPNELKQFLDTWRARSEDHQNLLPRVHVHCSG